MHYLICLIFFIFYTILSIVRHNHFGSFGFDLGIADQIVWKYSVFKAPIITVFHHPFSLAFTDHIEFIYLFLTPFYWIYNDVKTLLLLQTLLISFSGLPVYFLARKKGLNLVLSNMLLISYLAFYGIQNAIWFDVHSATFAAAFIPWFIYFLEEKRNILATVFFCLILFSKENMFLLTLLISFVYFLTQKRKILLVLIVLSIIYFCLVFLIYFPHFVPGGYAYQNSQGLFSNFNPLYLVDSSENRAVIFYSLAWFGFLPLLLPVYLIPFLGDLVSYFIVANNLSEAQGIFMHYRVTLAVLLVWPTIIVISKFKKLNNYYTALFLFCLTLFFQYYLHLPLSYLSKGWFWTEPSGGKNIQTIISFLPKNASVVAQNNLTPHLSHRDEIFTLWPEQKEFQTKDFCGEKLCAWFRWEGKPDYLIVDLSKEWDIRHLLGKREDYISGLMNLEKNGVIQKYQQANTTVLYKINKNIQ